MYLRANPRRGHDYWMVARAHRTGDATREERCLYLGRLDTLDPLLLEQKRQQIRALGDPTLSFAFDALIVKLGHPAPLPSLRDVDLTTVRSYGPELAFVRLAEGLEVARLINDGSPKGGGPPLGEMVVALATYVNQHPGSYRRFVGWYRRSALPIFLHLPPEQVTYSATLNALSYLQPERTRPWESTLYHRVLKAFHYRCERVDIDSTVKELDGRLCRVLAKFGRAKTGTISKRRQIMITFLVDQRGSLLGHEVFPGNTNDMTTLAPVDRRLRQDYGEAVARAPRVVDRGYTSLKNVNGLVRRKEPFLVAVRAKPGSKELPFLQELGPHEGWPEIEEGVRAASLERKGVKWVVTWNDEVAGRNGDGRRDHMEKAKEAFSKLSRAIEAGRVMSRSDRDRKVGAILVRYGMRRFLRVQGARRGLGFRVEETGAREEKEEGADGYQVYATTERWLTEKDVVKFYRRRDRIEKAIRTMSSCLGLAPVHVATPEHVRGHFFVHALGYQLRNAGQLKLEEKGETMSMDEALWELEQLHVVELTVKGTEVGIHRKLTTMDGTVTGLVQVFALTERGKFPGVEGSI